MIKPGLMALTIACLAASPSTHAGWVDAETGKPVKTNPFTGYLPATAGEGGRYTSTGKSPAAMDIRNPDHAFLPHTGQNLLWDQACGTWRDVKTGYEVKVNPFTGDIPGKIGPDGLYISAGKRPDAIDPGDPDHAFLPHGRTGRNLIWRPCPSSVSTSGAAPSERTPTYSGLHKPAPDAIPTQTQSTAEAAPPERTPTYSGLHKPAPGVIPTQAERTAEPCMQWINAKTGKPINTYPVGASPKDWDSSDPVHWHNPRNGNSYSQQPDGSWLNSLTGQPINTYPVGASSQDWNPGDPLHWHNPRNGNYYVRVPCPPPPERTPTYSGLNKPAPGALPTQTIPSDSTELPGTRSTALAVPETQPSNPSPSAAPHTLVVPPLNTGVKDKQQVQPTPVSGFSTPPPSGVCGPDVTEKVLDGLDRIMRDFNAASPAKQEKACSSLFNPLTAEHAWDLTGGFGAADAPEKNTPKKVFDRGKYWLEPYMQGSNCAKPRELCGPSVQFLGHCIHAQVVNYMMWGVVTSICDQYGLGQQMHYARSTVKSIFGNPPYDEQKGMAAAGHEYVSIFRGRISTVRAPGASTSGFPQPGDKLVEHAPDRKKEAARLKKIVDPVFNNSARPERACELTCKLSPRDQKIFDEVQRVGYVWSGLTRGMDD